MRQMHRSRVYALLIDTPGPEAAAAAAFWSAALGTPAEPVPGEEQFTTLHEAIPGLVTAIQSVDDLNPRFHIDIETDDVEAETTRLLTLGATETARWLECRVLRAPGGHLLCVLPVHSDPEVFNTRARTWS
ncbi:glyoxalase/bleomycin resistance/dioxygenase family protein [Streptomyces sp. NBC_01515]|uniref:VOC family protein n=1 Tax=Streptomyces sp. NBC_01515 TaxID=2903890 RepID=UPI00386E914A